MKQIYLDHNATTPVDPEVVDAMIPYLTGKFGNASSAHNFGRDAKVALENAREMVASVINCDPSELYFTSGGTESDNIAILGVAEKYKKKNHLLVGATEHHAILETAEYLEKKHDYKVSIVLVDNDGFILDASLNELLDSKTYLTSIMLANNETGTIQNLKPLVDIVHAKDSLFHTDAVQAIGKINVDVKELDVDLLTLTGHKIYGPKGVGALFVKQGIRLAPLFYGGSHEKKRRPGTENIAGIVGLAKALEIAQKLMDDDNTKLVELADYFIAQVQSVLPDVYLNGPKKNRIPQTVNLSFQGAEGESLLLGLDLKGIAVSSGSACTSGATEPSHVLQAMGIDKVISQGAIRFSMGRSTTKEELDYVVSVLPEVVNRLRELSPIYNK